MNLFYDTPILCGCSKCKGLKVNTWRVTLTHYINDILPKVDGLIPPTAVKDPIGIIEKTNKNTSIYYFFEKLEAKAIMFHPKLANLSPSVEPTKSSSVPKYDINTTQNVSTRRSKKLYKLRAKMYNYTPRSVKLLEGRDDFSLPIHLQSKHQTCYNCALYGTWPYSLLVPNVGI